MNPKVFRTGAFHLEQFLLLPYQGVLRLRKDSMWRARLGLFARAGARWIAGITPTPPISRAGEVCGIARWVRQELGGPCPTSAQLLPNNFGL